MPHVHYHGSPRLDQAGIGVSLACFVHCIAGAVIATVPSLLGTLGHFVPWLERLELVFLFSAITIGSFALVRARNVHGSTRPLALFAMGVSLWLVRFIAPQSFEILLTVSGACCVGAAHFVNLRSLQCVQPHAH